MRPVNSVFSKNENTLEHEKLGFN